MCLKETKLTTVNDFLVKLLWGDMAHNYSFQPSLGASRGILSLWDTSVVDVWSTMCFGHVLVIKGRVILTGHEFTIVNVYPPCDMVTKQALRDRLISFILNHGDDILCVCVVT